MSYSYAQLEGFWIDAGGPADVAPTAAAIAMAESGGANIIQQGQPYATTGWGPWQITPGNSEPSIGIDHQLLNGPTNARAAVAKYHAAIAEGLDGFEPWTTYTTRKYKQFLRDHVPPATGNDTASSSSSSSSGGGWGSGALHILLYIALAGAGIWLVLTGARHMAGAVA